ncbi:M15 family metallopeptidase [Arsenicicoccus sp. oral taxon 190]|uniref:M15 family metallopeptidase n=1 Tax=Arsenicicoccus sp. oral taxon 190 TaxID=1658671 RepID=UPI00067BA596|nr:M15 family metallopeptidase [Arsenicicoccus sp. oral taxon 190]
MSPAPARWLAEPDPALLDLVPPLPPLVPAATEAEVDAVTAGEGGEPLVELPPELPHRHCYAELGIASLPRQMLLRRDVVHRLLVAQRDLPEGFSLLVLDGWRTPAFQADLLAHYREQTGEALDGYVSDPTSQTRMAPHTTGGAVDLTLAHDGVGLALGTDFDSFDDGAHLLALESVGDDDEAHRRVARDLRRLLGQVLTGAGFAPYPLEWWHWSYGEQRWAAQHGHDRTIYAPVEAP